MESPMETNGRNQRNRPAVTLPGPQQILSEAALRLVEAPGCAIFAVTLEEELVASRGGPLQ